MVPYSMSMLSDVAARVLDAVGIEKADVVGILPRRRRRPTTRGRPSHPREPTTCCLRVHVESVRFRAPPRYSPILADAQSRNAVARPDPVGLLWQFVSISTWSSIPRLPT